jgi:hypothetical protein
VVTRLAPLRSGPDEELRAYAEAVNAEYRPKVHSEPGRVHTFRKVCTTIELLEPWSPSSTTT